MFCFQMWFHIYLSHDNAFIKTSQILHTTHQRQLGKNYMLTCNGAAAC